MATSGRIQTELSKSSCFFLQWQLASQSTANNSSTINWQAGLSVEGGNLWYLNAIRIDDGSIAGTAIPTGTWSNITSNGDHTLRSGSLTIIHDADGSKSFSGYINGWLYSYGNKTASGAWALPRVARSPRALIGVTHTRDSDNRNTVSWGYANSSDPLGPVYVYRSVDGGASAQVAVLGAGTTSYADTTTQTNHSYTYSVRTEWYSVWSGFSNSSAYTYNTPGAPGKPTASRVDATTVRLDFANSGITQTATEIARSTDGSLGPIVATVSGSNVTTTTNVPGGGTFYYQVRNTRGALVSDWSPISNAVVTIIAPAAPTLLSPTNGGVVKKSDNNIDYAWKHNPFDGSAQTEAQIRYSTNNGSTWTILTVNGSAQSYTLANNFAVNAAVVWQACTKGAHANYGPWSSSGSFIVCQVPQATITLPMSPLKNMPMSVAWDYSDQSGTQTAATVTLLTTTGAEVYRETLPGSGKALQISSAEFLPENLKTYTLRLEVRSSSSLTAVTEIALNVNYVPPAIPIGQIDFDEDQGAVSLLALAGEDNGTGTMPVTTAVGIFRKHPDGRIVTLVDHAQSGVGYYDAYPPLDQEIAYVIVAYTDAGVTSRLEIPVNIPSYGAAFFNFGNDFLSTAIVALDTECAKRNEHRSEMYQTAAVNNPYPLIFYGPSDDLQGTVSGTAFRDPKMLDIPSASSVGSIDELSQYRGIVIMRLPYEQVLPVDVTVSQSFLNDGMLSNISIDWVRVRANGLAI